MKLHLIDGDRKTDVCSSDLSDEFWQFIGQQLLWRIPYFVFAIILIYKLVEYALS